MREPMDRQHRVTLSELLDRLLGRGATVTGDVVLGVAGVDLIYLSVRALLASVATVHQLQVETQGPGGSTWEALSTPPPSRGAPRLGAAGSAEPSEGPTSPRWPANENERADGLDVLDEAARALDRRLRLIVPPSDASAEDLERGLGRLVLTLVELLRDLMERQALRRLEAGDLTDEQIDRMSETFSRLKARMAELSEIFGLEENDLRLDLGPLGDLF